MIKIKNRLFRRFRNTKDDKDGILYRRFRNKLSTILRSSEKEHYDNLFKENMSNLKNALAYSKANYQ